jgi:methionyl-tRNA formyltransferase
MTYAAKLGPDDQRVDWARPARDVDCQIRGLSPFPGAWCLWTPSGKDEPVRLKLLMSRRSGRETSAPAGMVLDDNLLVACGDGSAVRILRLQKPGGKPMDADQFLKGQAIAPDTVLA